MKALIVVITVLLFAASCSSRRGDAGWSDFTELADELGLTENEPGLYSSNAHGIMIRCDTIKREIHFACCPDYIRIASDMNYRDRMEKRQERFFKHVLPSWRGASDAFTQFWIALEASEQKEMTIPYNDLVIKVDRHQEECRSLTLTRK